PAPLRLEFERALHEHEATARADVFPSKRVV
ncbi:unnamed protein product, partial [marine sediment metagenome]